MDLFCGAGGLSLGLHSAGFEVIVGVDHDREALATHRANFPGLSVNWDLADEAVVDRIVNLGQSSGVELIAGGPPCQPFSKAGRSMIRDLVQSGRRNPKDHRRDLWESFVAVVDGVRPSAVLMENVPDMALDGDMQILRTMVDLLESMNYSVSARVLDTSRYEVPQFRQRLILVALANDFSFDWPEESGYQVTLRTAIGDLPEVEGGWRTNYDTLGSAHYGGALSEFQRRARANVPKEFQTMVFDHITRPVRPDDLIIFSAMDSKTRYSEIDEAVVALARVSVETESIPAESLKRYRDDIFDDKYKRLDWNQLSRTITAHIAKDGYSYIHPEQDRTLTVREAARIQTFPDEYRFAGPPSAAFKQIGNAVPPRLGEYLGVQILRSVSTGEISIGSTRDTSRLLSTWFDSRAAGGQLRFPWFSLPSTASRQDIRSLRWQVIQAELLLGRNREIVATTVWPLLKSIKTPRDALASRERILEFSEWIDRTGQAERVLSSAAWLVEQPAALDSMAGMNLVPNVTGATSALAAHVAPGPNEDPVIATSGMLRVAARFTNTPVDRRNSGTDGRIAIARMIGAEDQTSDKAFLGLIELAETVCVTSRPSCTSCPLQSHCIYFDAHQKPRIEANPG
jgi:DNA (cytosine-5)-methyltransferase 1